MAAGVQRVMGSEGQAAAAGAVAGMATRVGLQLQGRCKAARGLHWSAKQV